MRKTFYYPALRMAQKGNWPWILNQGYKFIALKYLHKIWPEKMFSGPVMGVIVASYRCNSNCEMCDLKKRGNLKKELTTIEMKNIIADFNKIHTSGISFTGGEPLLRKDIFDLISYVNSLGMVSTLNTNALLLNSQNIPQLISSRPDNINISLDSANPVIYDRLRGTKNGLVRLGNIMKNLTLALRKFQVPITLTAVTTISELNYQEIEDIARLAHKMGFHKIGFNPLHNIDHKVVPSVWKSKESMSMLFNKVKKIGLPIDNSNGFLKMFDRAFTGKPFPLACLSGFTSLFVDCYGDIFICWPDVEINKKLTNFQKQKISDLWYSDKYLKKARLYKKCRNCYWNCQAELSILFQ